jgi:hypothetical protein
MLSYLVRWHLTARPQSEAPTRRAALLRQGRSGNDRYEPPGVFSSLAGTGERARASWKRSLEDAECSDLLYPPALGCPGGDVLAEPVMPAAEDP